MVKARRRRRPGSRCDNCERSFNVGQREPEAHVHAAWTLRSEVRHRVIGKRGARRCIRRLIDNGLHLFDWVGKNFGHALAGWIVSHCYGGDAGAVGVEAEALQIEFEGRVFVAPSSCTRVCRSLPACISAVALLSKRDFQPIGKASLTMAVSPC